MKELFINENLTIINESNEMVLIEKDKTAILPYIVESNYVLLKKVYSNIYKNDIIQPLILETQYENINIENILNEHFGIQLSVNNNINVKTTDPMLLSLNNKTNFRTIYVPLYNSDYYLSDLTKEKFEQLSNNTIYYNVNELVDNTKYNDLISYNVFNTFKQIYI